MDGIDLAREVKMRWPHLVVVLTSEDGGEHLNQMSPGVEYIAKPWQLADVLTAAERARSTAEADNIGRDVEHAALVADTHVPFWPSRSMMSVLLNTTQPSHRKLPAISVKSVCGSLGAM